MQVGGDYPDNWDKMRRQAYKRDDYTCQNCLVKGGAKGDVELHAHHIVPLSKGGNNTLSNIKTLCRNCHSLIHDHMNSSSSKRSPITKNTQKQGHSRGLPNSSEANQSDREYRNRFPVTLEHKHINKIWHFNSRGGSLTFPVIGSDTVYVQNVSKGLYAIDAKTGEEQWFFRTGQSSRICPEISGNIIYTGNQSGYLYAINTNNGSEVWNFKAPDRIYTSPEVVNGTVYVGCTDNNLYAIDEVTGTKKWEFNADDSNSWVSEIQTVPIKLRYSVSSVTVENGTVYVGDNNGYLYALDANTGTRERRCNIGHPLINNSVVIDNTVYIGCANGSLHAIDANTGTKMWNFDTCRGVSSPPTVIDDTAYISTFMRPSKYAKLYALNRKSGNKKWDFDLGATQTSPTVVDGTVYAGNNDGILYAIDTESGSEQWQIDIEERISTKPAVLNGAIYIGNCNGGLYKISYDC